MVKRDLLHKSKHTVVQNPGKLKSHKLSTSVSSSTAGTPSRQNPRSRPSEVSSSSDISRVQTPKKIKRKRAPMNMLVGRKVFTISANILREIKRYQTTTNNLIPKLPFSRLVQEIISEYLPQGHRIQRAALEALQESAENYLVQYFEDSYVCTLHARRCTLIPRDMEVVQRLRPIN